ncbi:MAG: type transport system permease protein [Solirubrobacteraceae bacterium]|jgi:ABC-2 type transport system permease protein|nr:type transport system permease protein [Solirubrobacteraceae bacterium]
MRLWWPNAWLIARREIAERSRAKSLWITTAIMILGVAAAVIVPTIIGHHQSTEKVGLVGAAGPSLRQAVTAAGRVTGDRVELRAVASVAVARTELKSGALSVAIVDGREILIKKEPVSGSTSSESTFAGAVAELAGLVAKLSPAAAQTALAEGIAIPVRGLEGAPKSLTSRFTGLGVALVIYIVIFFYGMRITQSVGEEKTSRVVEVLLATVAPTQLLMGKVIGFAAIAFAQILAVAATFGICGVTVGSNAVHGTAGGVVLIGVLWLVLGFALYCSAFAAAGSLITRQSDAANAAFPLFIPLILAYSLANGVLFNGSNSFYDVLGYVPWTAPVAMPTLFAIGAVSAWQVAASAVLCVLATLLTARLAGVVYARSVMQTGARVKLRQVLRADAGRG